MANLREAVLSEGNRNYKKRSANMTSGVPKWVYLLRWLALGTSGMSQKRNWRLPASLGLH